jgi:hypothetical protein
LPRISVNFHEFIECNKRKRIALYKNDGDCAGWRSSRPLAARQSSVALLSSAPTFLKGAAMSDPVLCKVEEGIATITLNRPERGNAIDSALGSAFVAAVERVAADQGARGHQRIH